MVRRYPHTIRWRQALPPLFVLSLVCLAVLAIWMPFAGILLAIELLLYFSMMILAGFQAALPQQKTYLILGLPLAILTMHTAWGSGFLWSMFTSSVHKDG
jgi:hypothetical protein